MKKFRVLGVLAAGALLLGQLPANADATIHILTAPPELVAQAPLPFTGQLVSAPTVPASLVNLTTTPSAGVLGDAFTISGKGLSANTAYTLVWKTTQASWRADIDPTTVNYRGTSYAPIYVSMGGVTTDVSGSFTWNGKVPADFGSTHDIYLVKDGAAAGLAGFQINRTVKISPTSGPVGTPITVTYTGMGASLYTSGASINYDNHYAGQMLALWTRGTGTAVIRAAGDVGNHHIQVADAITYMYMNILQSPVPWALGDVKTFKVTKDAGLIKPYIKWPKDVTPQIADRTTMSGLNVTTTAKTTLTPNTGPILEKVRVQASGLPSDGTVSLAFSTVVGSRVDCPKGSTSCWKFSPISLGTANVSGGILDTQITIPDNLGGYHVVQVIKDGAVLTQAPYYVKASLPTYTDKKGNKFIAIAKANNTPAFLPAGVGEPTYTFKAGEEFTITVKGVGWTQMDNTMNVTYDNSFVGYGCGFNSNGYMAIHMIATGKPGTHIIDLWPNLYSANPSFSDTQYGMAPLLSGFQDSPALALGYKVPSIHLTIKVVK